MASDGSGGSELGLSSPLVSRLGLLATVFARSAGLVTAIYVYLSSLTVGQQSRVTSSPSRAAGSIRRPCTNLSINLRLVNDLITVLPTGQRLAANTSYYLHVAATRAVLHHHLLLLAYYSIYHMMVPVAASPVLLHLDLEQSSKTDK